MFIHRKNDDGWCKWIIIIYFSNYDFVDIVWVNRFECIWFKGLASLDEKYLLFEQSPK